MDFFGEYTGLYFYSAVFQGNMALIALFGALVVFRFQQLQTLCASEDRACWEHVRSVFQTRLGVAYPLNIRTLTVEGIKAALEQLAEESTAEAMVRSTAKEILGSELFYSFGRSQEGLVRVEDALKRSLQLPLVLNVVIVVLSLMLVAAALAIHEQGTLLEAGAFAAVLALECVTLKYTLAVASPVLHIIKFVRRESKRSPK